MGERVEGWVKRREEGRRNEGGRKPSLPCTNSLQGKSQAPPHSPSSLFFSLLLPSPPLQSSPCPSSPLPFPSLLFPLLSLHQPLILTEAKISPDSSSGLCSVPNDLVFPDLNRSLPFGLIMLGLMFTLCPWFPTFSWDFSFCPHPLCQTYLRAHLPHSQTPPTARAQPCHNPPIQHHKKKISNIVVCQ